MEASLFSDFRVGLRRPLNQKREKPPLYKKT